MPKKHPIPQVDVDGVLAVKIYSTHPDDNYLYMVIRKLGDKFATHIFNAHDGGFHNGHYIETLKQAMRNFNSRGVI